jgi:hypothetical protein
MRLSVEANGPRSWSGNGGLEIPASRDEHLKALAHRDLPGPHVPGAEAHTVVNRGLFPVGLVALSGQGDQPFNNPNASITRELASRAFGEGVFRLPHEDPDTEHPVDARRWVVVYQELVQFKVDLVARLQGSISGFTPEAQAELSGTDLSALLEQLGHYEQRLAFWQARLWQLEGLALNPDSSTISYQGRCARLTGREFTLLRFLLEHPGGSFTAKQLAAEAWSKPGIFPEEVRTYIARLRTRLQELKAPCGIVNVPRIGYRVEFDRDGLAVSDSA